MKFWLWIAAALVVGGLLGDGAVHALCGHRFGRTRFYEERTRPRRQRAFQTRRARLAWRRRNAAGGPTARSISTIARPSSQAPKMWRGRNDGSMRWSASAAMPSFRRFATKCRLEHLSVAASSAPHAASLHGDDHLIDVFMRFTILAKAGH